MCRYVHVIHFALKENTIPLINTAPQRINIFVLTCQHQATAPSYKMHLTWTFKSHRHERSIKYAYL